MNARLIAARARAVAIWGALSPWSRDAWLYGLSSAFALGLALSTTQPAQRYWGWLAAGPYALAGVIALFARRWRPRGSLGARVALTVLVGIGALAIPLGLEARWRHSDPGLTYAQPEVGVIERSAGYVAKGLDPYRAYVRNGHVVNAVPGLPAYESFFPYLPLMSVFGLPSAATHQSTGLTDARIVMSLATVLVMAAAMFLLRAPPDRRLRVAQALAVLPTGALFLSTGGDDMPILALLLLGIVALERRSWRTAGVSLGLAAAMKLTAWPVIAVVIVVVALRGRSGRGWLRVAATVASLVAVTVAPFALLAPRAFVANVVAFPLGLAGVASPAASPLPGHLLAEAFPVLGHLLIPLTLVVMGVFAWRYSARRWPLTLPQALGILAVVYTAVILAASATRIGYVIYPLNILMWAWALTPVRAPQVEPAGELELAGQIDAEFW